MFDSVRRTYHLVGDGRRWKWAALVALALVATAVEAIGASLVFMLLALITEPEAAPRIPLVGDVGRMVSQPGGERLIVALALGIAVFFVLRSVLIFVQSYAQHRIAHNAGARLATRLLRGYLAMPYAFHLRRHSAVSIRNTLYTVQELVNGIVVPAVRLAADAFVVLGLLVVLLVVSPLATVLAAAVLGPLVWLLLRFIHPRLKRMGSEAQAAMGDGVKAVQQSLQGIRDVQLLGRAPHFVGRFASSRRIFAHSQYMRGAMAELPSVLIEAGLVVFIVMFLAVALMGGAGDQAVLSVLGLFAYIGLRLQPSLRKIATSVNSIRYNSAALEALWSDTTVIDRAGSGEVSASDRPELTFRRSLRLRRVAFTYDTAATPALHDIDLRIRRGEAVGVCGPTGGGKTTLVDIIVGLLPPTSGQVLVDGRDVREHLASWHQRIGMVSQSTFMLDDTLRRNIAFGLPDEDIDEERVRRAVRLAQLEPLVAQLSDELDTWVGEQGVRLSGGQRQRVAIARALYRDPEVLIFDEGTSALDNETEMQLVEAIEQLRGSRMIIMVAHRLTTVRRCDRIVVVEGGRIADTGTFDELVGRHRLFAGFAAS